MYDTTTSIFAGMSTAALQAALANAQQAYLDLSTGAKGESYSYTQGDGAKSVTYTRANLGSLVALIKQLQVQLGVVTHGRRPIRFNFR
ncbi:MAG: phage head-tail adapter protein [Pseudomonadota bacterium]|nr:phage head-tail adapter protein [Pseudomonadota bacterium]